MDKEREKIATPLQQIGVYDRSDYSIYDHLEEQGWVVKEYEKCFRKDPDAGVLYRYKRTEGAVMLITTNMHMHRYESYHRTSRKVSLVTHARLRKYMILFELTEEGWSYIKNKVLERRL